MSDRAYTRVANLLMVIGVASALAFDSGRMPHAIAGAFGIAAGVGAFLLYFCGSKEAAGKKEEMRTADVETQLSALAAAPSKQRTVYSDLSSVYALLRESPQTVLGHPLYRNHLLARAFWHADVDAIEAYRRQTAHVWLSHYALDHARKLHWGVVEARGTGMVLMEPEVELSPNEVAACAVEIIRGLAVSDDADGWEYVMGPKGLRVAFRRSASMHPIGAFQEDLDFGDAMVAYKIVDEIANP